MRLRPPSSASALSVLCAVLGSTVPLAGCNEIAITNVEVTDVFEQSPFEKVDVLLVVDNSGSMEPYQEKLGEDFGGFFDFFEFGEVDWRLAVTHTDSWAYDFGRVRGPIVTADTPDPVAVFREVVNVGNTGGGLEAGLEAAARLLERQDMGFPREDASVSVIFVSDEEDASPRSVSSYVNRFFNLRGQRQRSAFNASALTVTELAGCTPEQFAQSAPGSRYVEVARLTGGITANLCVDDFTPIVRDLALTTSSMQSTFPLKARPDLGTLQVRVQGQEIPCDAGVWTYDLVEHDGAETPAIVFFDDRLPEAAAAIVVEYNRGRGDPADFCVAAEG